MTSTTDYPPHSRSERRRRLVIPLATVGTALTLLASEAVDPVGDGTADNLVAAATTHEGAMIASAVLLLLSAVLLIPAIVGMIERMPQRGSGIGHVGAVLLTLGAFGHAMAATFFLVVSAIPDGPSEPAATVALVEHLNTSPSIAVAFVFILAFGLGLLLAFIGLHRAGVIPAWVLGTIVAAFAIEVVAPGDVVGIALVKQTLGLVGFSYLAMVHWQAMPAAHRSPIPNVDRVDPALSN
jgi:hypothetical protein